MAGIGFELRKYLQYGTYFGVFKAYGYASILGSGPWLLSILGVMLVGTLSISMQMEATHVIEFVVTVTWLMASSLILTGVFLIAFIRFVADSLYEEKNEIILPNVRGVLACCSLISASAAIFFVVVFFSESSTLYRLLLVFNFVVLCNLWFSVVFSSAMKQYRLLLLGFVVGYLIVVISSIGLQSKGLEGLLSALFIGHGALFFFIFSLIHDEYPSAIFIRFDFLQREKIYIRLIFIGLFYNIGIWADKILFWLSPATSAPIIGPLRASLVYDLPVFLAYLTIIPGMAVFLIKVETDFSEAYNNYYHAVREGESLQKIEEFSGKMLKCVLCSLIQIVKVQGVIALGVCLFAPAIIEWFEISSYYLNVLIICSIAVATQLIVLSVLNFLFYLDRLTEAFWVTLLLMISNYFFTWVSLQFDPKYYGLGFLGSMAITSIVGLALLYRTFQRLEFYTFMLQR